MPAEQSYSDALKQDLGGLIAATELPEMSKHFLRSRWLDQLLWAEGRANSARGRYFLVRVIAIIGGVIVPALVSINAQPPAAPATAWLAPTVGWLTFTVSLAVAICMALEGFFRWGERWTHYRRLSELLKSEGWLFFQLAGPYQEAGSHAKAYPEFARRVEALVAADVDAFITQVAQKSKSQGEGEAAGGKP